MIMRLFSHAARGRPCPSARPIEANGHPGTRFAQPPAIMRSSAPSKVVSRVASLVFATGIVLSLTAPVTSADALPSLSSLGLVYGMSKARSTPEGDLAARIAEVDTALFAAFTSGRAGEARRQLARGLALTSRGTWTETDDFSASLVLRTSNDFVDPSRLLTVRLGQIYPSTLLKTSRISVQLALHEKRTGRRGRGAPGKKLMDLGNVPDAGFDLIAEPAVAEIDVSKVADGDYEMYATVMSEGAEIGTTSVLIYVRRNLDTRVAALRAGAASASERLQADILYPLDFMRKVNAGMVPSRGFDIDEEIAAAESVAEAAKANKDPFTDRAGDFERHYLLSAAGEIMPYRIFVPAAYVSSNPTKSKNQKKRRKGKPFPLIVALHGLGGNEDSMFREFYGMKPLAEERGYIMVAPMGYRVDGGYGSSRRGDPRRGELSEADVMQVLDLAQETFNIDKRRIYLMGHSMGAIGTWRIAAKHPDIWAGLGPIAGRGDPNTADTIKHIAQVVVHGDADRTVSVEGSRQMVKALQDAEATVSYLEVPGGGHSDIAPQKMADIFDFFDKHKRKRL